MRITLPFRLAVLALSFVPIIFAQNSKTPPQKALPKDYSFKLKASQIWTDTGLDLNPGDRIHISGADLDCGGPAPGEKAHLLLPSAPGGALVAKIQPEAAPFLATPDADLPIVAPSHLYLGVNGHCSGTMPARVHVEWHKAPAQNP